MSQPLPDTAPRWRERLRAALRDLALGNTELDHYLGSEDPAEGPSAPHPGSSATRAGYLGAVVVVAICTMISWLTFHRFDPRNLAMVYLLGIVFVATRFGRGPSALASCLAVASFEYCFMPPYFDFDTDEAQSIFTFAVMLLVALLISGLASRVREQAEQARQRGRRTQILYAMTRELASLGRPREIADAARRHLTDVFKAKAIVALADSPERLDASETALGDNGDVETARAAMRSGGRPGGLGEAAATTGGALYLPLVGSSSVVGVVGLHCGAGNALSGESRALLETLTQQITVSVERARLAQKAEQAEIDIERERLRNALLASVSHDLRTPLSVITGAASSLVGDHSLSPDARHELGSTIYEESEHLNRLVGNLLDMTRVQSGDLKVHKEWHSLEEIAGSAVRRLKKVLRDHPVHAGLPTDLPLVPLDAVLIEQVFVNLLENAAKHTPKGSRIDIAAAWTEGEVTVSLADAGPGLPPEEQGRLFDKFFRGGGVGLGLAICHAIVAAHGGRIWASNRAGGGALFSLSLPLHTAPVAEPLDSDEPR